MATLAKILGVLCLIASGLIGLNVLLALANTGQVDDELASAVVGLVVVAQMVAGLLLATVGVVAWVVGDAGQRRNPPGRPAEPVAAYGDWPRSS